MENITFWQFMNRGGKLFILIFILTILSFPLDSFADSICGDPPPVANESLKGEIQGKAQILSKYVGDAVLSGKIETSRKEIFSKYPEAEKTRANAYFEYQVCILVMNDKTLNNMQKLEELRKTRREFRKEILGLSAEDVKNLNLATEKCENGDFRKARTVFSDLMNRYPEEKSVKRAQNNCDSLENTPFSFQIAFDVRPGVNMFGESSVYFAAFEMVVDGHYCGALENGFEPGLVNCDSLPGQRTFLLRDMTVYDSNKNLVFQNGSCGGPFLLKTAFEKYGILICLKKPIIKCAIVPVDESYLKFTKEGCIFDA
jgi:hypothetical protein